MAELSAESLRPIGEGNVVSGGAPGGTACGMRHSVAMATFNGESHILEQLESLAAQTWLPAELVITDDGSTDRTLAIVAEFAERSPFPIRIHPNPTRLLFADNFLRAASLCSGSLIAFCDQDDVWSPEKLEASLHFFEDPEVLLSAHTSQVWDGTRTTGSIYPDFAETGLHPALTLDPFQLVPGFVMVFRRELLEVTANHQRLRNIFTIGGVAKPMGHDQWVWFLATILGKVATIAEPQALYRQHAMNVVGAPRRSGWLYNVTLALREVSYGGLAVLEGDAARLAAKLAESRTGDERKNSLAAAGKLADRERYHASRALLYDPRSSAFVRIRSFAAILRSGGYQDDHANYRLGRRAAFKDLAFGVTGLDRFAEAKGA